MIPSLEGLIALAFAAALGSFLGTMGVRLVADFRIGGDGRAIMRLMSGRSNCACGARPLAIRDLVPLISAALNRGRCRVCARRLPGMEPAAEAAAVAAAMIALLMGAGGGEAILFGAASATALLLAWIDLKLGLLPDALLAVLAVLGAASLGLAQLDAAGWAERATAAALGGGLLLGLRWLWIRVRGVEALGLGDMKLVAVCGLWLGLEDLPALIILGAGATLATALARHGMDWRRAVPLGPGLLAGLIGLLFWRMIRT